MCDVGTENRRPAPDFITRVICTLDIIIILFNVSVRFGTKTLTRFSAGSADLTRLLN